MQAEHSLRYSRNAARRICIDLLSILPAKHAEVVAAIAASVNNSQFVKGLQRILAIEPDKRPMLQALVCGLN